MRLSGAQLRVGDTIEVWWGNRRDTLTGLSPYNGPLAYLFKEGAQHASFALFKVGMTIDNSDYYTVVARAYATVERSAALPFMQGGGGFKLNTSPENRTIAGEQPKPTILTVNRKNLRKLRRRL